MDTSYIYSVSRVNALGDGLLSVTDMERLLVAAPGAELHTALKETYLAPYVLQVPGEHMPTAIELTLTEAKELLTQIAPRPEIFQVLWLQHDVHNLRVFAKATKDTLSDEVIARYVSHRGCFDPMVLREHAVAGTLNAVQAGWQTAYDQAVQHVTAREIDRVDGVFDALLFATIVRVAQAGGSQFMQRVVVRMIDMHNCKQALRLLRLPDTAVTPAHVPGGTLTANTLTSVDAVGDALEGIAPGVFADALTSYNESGNTTMFDAAIDDQYIAMAKTAATDMFTTASLVLYYLRVRQAAANVRTIVVGVESGQSATLIRSNLRTAYVNN